MEFIVRILFTGMMVFVPNNDGTELDIILLNAGHTHQLSDGTRLTQHKPIILARGNCSGDCTQSGSAAATALFADLPTSVGLDAVNAAADGVWVLENADVSLVKGTGQPDLPALQFQTGTRNGIIPTTSAERADTEWLVRLSEICPDCGFNEDVLGSDPPADLVAARFHLKTGNFFTYSVAKIGANVTPVQFKRVDGTGSASSYTQAIATIMGADITVSGDSIRLVETKFDGTSGRTMTLSPDSNNRVEIAVLNLPPLVPATPSATPGIGKHFERFYDVTQDPPSASARRVPQPGAAPGAPSYSTVTWQSIHPPETLWSELLNALRMSVNRSEYDITLCPPVREP